MKIRDLFNNCATNYDQSRPQLIPCFNKFYGTILEEIPFENDEEIKVLDLGSGTGLLAAMLHKKFINARFTLSDLSEKMLQVAKERFSNNQNIQFLIQDNRDLDIKEEYNVIVSSLSIHHLSDSEKAKLYASCFDALLPDGIFINADQVLGPTPAEEEEYQNKWEREIRQLGATSTVISEAKTRMLEDKNSLLSEQLLWLDNAGFNHTKCYFQNGRFAVFGGIKNK